MTKRTVVKNTEKFAVAKGLSEKSEHFFTERYPKWEQSSFWVYDYFSSSEKTFIDIGGWNGCTAIYAARKNKHVISLEPDPISLRDFDLTLKANRTKNITLIKKPIFHSNEKVHFAPLQDTWNTSSSHIKEAASSDGKDMQAITLSDINKVVHKIMGSPISNHTVSLVKIDIESGEQYLLQDILRLDKEIPLYVSMHIEWWQKENKIEDWQILFDRYKYLYATTSFGHEDGDSIFKKITASQAIEYINKNPFTSIVFSQQNIRNIPTKNILNEWISKLKN